jgi:hypothetical protein
MRIPAAQVAKVLFHFIHGVPNDVEVVCENRCGAVVLPHQGVRGALVFCNDECSLEHFEQTAS